MCLIDAVLTWDASAIRCRSESHRRDDNPLRRHGRLAGVHAFEYGAQAAAIHGGLLAAADHWRPPAYLAAIREAWLAVECLDTVEGCLEIGASLLLAEGGNAIYFCRIDGAGATLAEARLTIMRRK